jgi:phospholipid/cholesterol/gamma-HCH transport system substrate-binding protein
MRRNQKGMSNYVAGLIALVVAVSGTFFGFSRWNPFADPYEMVAVFESANNLKSRSQVRIAGVNVGKVTKVETIPESGAARVTMELEESALPLHEDAELRIRPNLFLEGNFFVDVHPGSPSAPELESGEIVPSQQTSTPVQFGQILAALQSDTRRDLQVLLDEYSRALAKGGAEALNRSIEYWEAAYKNSAIAAEASLGQEPDKDIQRLIKGQAKVFKALAQNPETLKSLVTNFNTTAAALAREDIALQRTIPALDRVLRVGSPALASLNDALPSLRAFARDALPGTRSSGPAIDASLPFIRQARRLVADDELKGLAADLRSAIPDLVRLQTGAVGFFRQTRLLSSCQNRVLLPFAKAPIPEEDAEGNPLFPDNNNEPFYKQSSRGLVGLSGESRIHDAQTPIFRVQASGGPFSVHFGDVGGEDAFAQAPFPIEGVNPIKPDKRPGFRPDVPCETQEPPNLASRPGAGERSEEVSDSASLPKTAKQRRELGLLVEHMKLTRKGVPSLDPLAYRHEISRRYEARRNGWRKNSKGLFSYRGIDSSGRAAK